MRNVSFGYGKDAEEECAARHERTGRIIKLLIAQEILDEAHVRKLENEKAKLYPSGIVNGDAVSMP